jgi:hypothetical protein
VTLLRKLTPMTVLTFAVTTAALFGKAKYGFGFFGGK